MSEEEIIERIEEIIDCLKDDDITLYAGTDDKAIQGLLDLYQKEKTRRIKYGNILFEHNLVEDLDDFFEE